MDIKKTHFTITGKNGLPMACDITYPVGDGPWPVVVYAHGINGFKDWGGMNLIADTFAHAGLAFLKFNFSHNGTTPAHPEQFVDLETYGKDNYTFRQQDLRSLIDFIEEHASDWPISIDDISLIGHSRGGTDALLFAAESLRIKRLITWAAPCEATTPWRKWDSEKIKLWRETGVIHLKNGRTGQQMPLFYQLYKEYKAKRHNSLNTEQKAREMHKPWLIVHGEDDEAVFVKDAYQWKEWQPSAQVFIIPGAGHTFGRKHPWTKNELPEESQKLAERTIAFIKD